MRLSTLIITIAVCIIAVVAIIYGTAFFACKHKHSGYASHGCCSGGQSGGTVAPFMNTRLSTVVNAPPAAVGDPITVIIDKNSQQPIYFSTQHAGTPTEYPWLVIKMVSGTGTEIPLDTIATSAGLTNGTYTITNSYPMQKTYKLYVTRDGTNPFTEFIPFLYPPDYHDFDCYYKTGPTSAIVAIH
jgi:hypothetical protein